MGQAEQIGGEGGQHRRQRRVAERQPRIHRHNGPSPGKQERRRKPQRHAEEDEVGGAAADLVAEQGHQQPPGRTAHTAQHHGPEGGALVQPPLHPKLQDDGAEQQHRRGGKADRSGAEPVLPRAKHLPGREVEGRRGFSLSLPAGLRFFGRWVGQQCTAREADRQGQRTQRPERAPDALHRPEAPQRRADKDGQERSAQPHCAPDDAGGEALPALVPLLGAGLDGRIEEGRAEPCRDAEHPEKSTPLLCRESRRREESAAEQARPPQSRKAWPLLILQKAADDAPDAEKCDEHPEGIACPLLAEAVFLHDGSLEHAPRGGQACQYLDGRACRQDGPGSCFLHFVHHLRE